MIRIKRNKVLFAIHGAMLNSAWKDFLDSNRKTFFKSTQDLLAQILVYMMACKRNTFIEWH